MKFIGYVRVTKLANGKPKFVMSSKPSAEPLRDSNQNALATVQFAVKFDVPDEALQVPLAATVPVVHVQHAVDVQEIPL